MFVVFCYEVLVDNGEAENISNLGKRHILILSTRNVIWTLGGEGLAPVTFSR